MRRVVLLGALKVLRRVHGDPEALVPEGEELPLVGQLRERRLLVVAALRQPLERLVVEDVDPRIDPVRQVRRLAEAAHTVAGGELDDSELGPERRDDDRRRTTVLLVGLEERP